MILVLDAGNTRIKWGVFDAGTWLAEGALAQRDAAALHDVAKAYPSLRRAVGVNVAGPAVADAIARALDGLLPPPAWVRTSGETCGVKNLYTDPSQLGADRWAALVGARALHPHACLVVTAGTATTVDVLDACGVFLGGLILPGDELMRRALAGNTAQLPFADGHFADLPRSTHDAIVSGCLNAQLGAIERMFRPIAALPDACCLLSGGGADALAGQLAVPHRRIDNLVLKGVAVMALDEETHSR